MTLKSMILMPALLLFSVATKAQIQVLRAGSSGTGCPGFASAQVTTSPENTSISILYTEMATQAEGENQFGEKICKTEIDLQIPPGKQLELTQVDFRGFFSLSDAQAWGRLNSVVCFQGGSAEVPGFGSRMPGCTLIGGFGHYVQGPLTEPFFLQSGIFKDGKTVRNISRCNGVAKLRIKTTVNSRIDTPTSSSVVVLDSADFQFSQKYNFHLAPCDSTNQRVEKICKRGTCHEYPLN